MTDRHEIDQTVLETRSVCGQNQNRHELLVGKCQNCGTYCSATREELDQAGWRLAVENRLDDHEGFLLCPDCVGPDYSWEDLY